MTTQNTTTTQNEENFATNYDAAIAQLRIVLPVAGVAMVPFAWAMSEFAGVSFMNIITTTVFAGGLGTLVFLKRVQGVQDSNDD